MRIEYLNLHLPNFNFHTRKSNEQVERIKWIASQAITQAATATAVSFAVRLSIGSFMLPHTFILLTSAVQVGLVLLAIQKIAGHSFHSLEKVGGKLARLSLVNTFTLKMNHYIHEYGHALTALCTFVNANPKVRADFRGGSTTYYTSYGLTRFGELLGEERCKLLIAAAGPLASVLFGSAEIALSSMMNKDHPLIAELLSDHGFVQIAETMLYGLSAFTASKINLSHDFIYLWQYGGIHPVVPLLLIALGLYASRNYFFST
jgi:hypothetical protein